MGATFENLRVVQHAEEIADRIWGHVTKWEPFARKVVGEQLTRAADSIGANIAESFGRFHYGEKLQFLYYARGSLFETKYWLNRASKRQLLTPEQSQDYAARLTDLARQLNAFANSVKTQRKSSSKKPQFVREPTSEYLNSKPLFNSEDLAWLESVPISS